MEAPIGSGLYNDAPIHRALPRVFLGDLYLSLYTKTKTAPSKDKVNNGRILI